MGVGEAAEAAKVGWDSYCEWHKGGSLPWLPRRLLAIGPFDPLQRAHYWVSRCSPGTAGSRSSGSHNRSPHHLQSSESNGRLSVMRLRGWAARPFEHRRARTLYCGQEGVMPHRYLAELVIAVIPDTIANALRACVRSGGRRSHRHAIMLAARLDENLIDTKGGTGDGDGGGGTGGDGGCDGEPGPRQRHLSRLVQGPVLDPPLNLSDPPS